MILSDYIAIAAVVLALVSLRFSWLSWKASIDQVKASLFAERMAVFKDVKTFMNPWFRDGRPNLMDLYLLVNAWGRSQFLFEPSVTTFLRKLWKDAVRADYHARIVSGELNGDHQQSVEIEHEINSQYLIGDAEQPDVFVEAFTSMKMEQ